MTTHTPGPCGECRYARPCTRPNGEELECFRHAPTPRPYRHDMIRAETVCYPHVCQDRPGCAEWAVRPPTP